MLLCGVINAIFLRVKNLFFVLIFPLVGAASDLFLSPALTDNALAVTTNSAGLATYRRSNLVMHSAANPESLFVGAGSVGGFGLGVHRAANNTAYYLTNGFRVSSTLFMGIRSGYMDGQVDNFYKYDFGLMYRPVRFLSFGGFSDNLIHGNADVRKTYVVGAGLKLLEFVVVHADATHAGSFSSPRVGAEILLGGINLIAMADLDDKSYSLGFSMSFPHLETGFLFPTQKNRVAKWAVALTTDRKPALFTPRKKVALISIAGRLRDEETEFSLFGDNNAIPLVRVLAQLRNAERDADIGVVILKIGNLASGLGMVEELRNAIIDLRLTGKKVICYMENVSLLEYYLACAADEIIIEPMGSWVVLGVSAEITFFKGLFDKIGIKAEFERVGKYKSAVEPWVYTHFFGESHRYRHYGQSLGTSVGPNGDLLHLSLFLTPARQFRLEIFAEQLRKGTGEPGDRITDVHINGENPTKVFLGKNVVNQQTAGLEIRYEVSRLINLRTRVSQKFSGTPAGTVTGVVDFFW